MSVTFRSSGWAREEKVEGRRIATLQDVRTPDCANSFLCRIGYPVSCLLSTLTNNGYYPKTL